MLLVLPKLLGVIGLILITLGIFAKKEITQDWIFVAGGAGLLVYSISLRDPIFIPLQVVLILASMYEIIQLKRKKKTA